MKFENIDKKVNEENIKLFKRYDISRQNARIYTCVCCGRKTSISSSTSVEGAYLVCTNCVYDKFKCYRNVMQWQDEMLKKEKEENEKK